MTPPKPISEVIKDVKKPVSKIDYGYRILSLCIPNCELCEGDAWISAGAFPIDHPKFGQLILCPNLPPRPIKWNLFGLSEKFASLDWEDVRDYNDAHKIVTLLKKLVGQGYGWLYLHGINGLGKTFLSSITVAEALRKGMSAEIMQVSEMLLYFKDTFSNESSLMDRMNQIIELGVLVLDEYGAHKPTEWASETIQIILQKRYRNASEDGKGITIFTSELAPEDCLDTYIQSRLDDGRFGKDTIIKMVGKSVRTVADKLESIP